MMEDSPSCCMDYMSFGGSGGRTDPGQPRDSSDLLRQATHVQRSRSPTSARQCERRMGEQEIGAADGRAVLTSAEGSPGTGG